MTDARYDWTLVPFVLTIRDVSAILRVSATTLRRRIATGTMQPPPLPHVGKTSAYLWSRRDVQEFIEGGARAPASRTRRYFASARA